MYGMTKIPKGEWYINIDGMKLTGKIISTAQSINCLIDIWELKTHDKRTGSAQIHINAPRTMFRKVKLIGGK